MSEPRVDVQMLAGPGQRAQVLKELETLAVGERLVLIGDHDVKRLADEIEIDRAGEFGWQEVERGPEHWRVLVTRCASTPLPEVLCDTGEVAVDPLAPDTSGALWKLRMNQRDLDSNIIHLQPNAKIEAHDGPALDVLLHVLHGGGQLVTEVSTLALRPGGLLWLPRRSRREFRAGANGLTYLTVHQRRPGLAIETAPRIVNECLSSASVVTGQERRPPSLNADHIGR